MSTTSATGLIASRKASAWKNGANISELLKQYGCPIPSRDEDHAPKIVSEAQIVYQALDHSGERR